MELVRSEPNVSFFLAYLYLSLRAANESEPFRYRLAEGQVLVHERIHAGTTVLLDDESFGFAYFDHTEDFARFQAAAREAMAQLRARKSFDPQDRRTDLIHYSILPWVSFTSFSHARNWGAEDSIPKIVFGKASEQKGEWLLPVSVEVHHALMDGPNGTRVVSAHNLKETWIRECRSHPALTTVLVGSSPNTKVSE